MRQLDRALLDWLKSLRTDALTDVMLAISWLGSWPIVLLLSALAALLVDRWSRTRLRTTVTMLFALVTQLVIVQGLKMLFGRSRPANVEALASTSDASFPSGHASAAATVTVVLWLAVSAARPQWRVPAAICALLGITLMCVSRMYLGVHYLSDVLVGAAVGAAVAAGATALVRSAYPVAKASGAPERTG